MDIEKLVELSIKDKDASKRASIGFKERISKRNKVFSKQAKSIERSKEYLERSYDI